MLPSRRSVVVAGGGPAGYLAAITAAECDPRASVVVLEATAEPLHKVRISGGGRCNVTHACWEPRSLLGHYPRGGKALLGPFHRFAPVEAVAWFAERGLELVEEADGRLFPRSQRSESVVDCLRQAARRAGVELRSATAVQRAAPLPQGGFQLGLRTGETLQCAVLVLATGSHPSGHRLSTAFGHGLVPPVPSLFTLRLEGTALPALAGVTVDPVVLELEIPGCSQRYHQRGPLLITHWGVSGPAVLRLSAFAARDLRQAGYRARLQIDWSGGQDPGELRSWAAQQRQEQGRRQLGSSRPCPSVGRRLWDLILQEAGVDPQRRWADLARAQEQAVLRSLLAGSYGVVGRGPFGEEFVTAGGVPLEEIRMSTMESRLCRGLFLVGELLNVDGVTGGFNFQHCWTSGWLAGHGVAAHLAELQ
jgi:hypothetical protein